jgi:hypothetical protein
MPEQQETDWTDYIEAVATDIFGTCNETLSSAPENVRFGNRGAVAVNYTSGTWYSFEDECGGGVMDMIRTYRNIEDPAAIIAYAEECREKFENGAAPPRLNGNNGASYTPPPTEQEAIYRYCNAAGGIASEVLRLIYPLLNGGYVVDVDGKRKKSFMQRRPSGEPDGSMLWGLSAGEYMRQAPGKNWVRFDQEKFDSGPASKERKTFTTSAPIVPYRLVELLAAIAGGKVVYLAEGEKKVDLLFSLGFVATCCAGGAKKWQPEHNAFLQGADVVLLPDNDPAGREHVENIAKNLSSRVKRLRLLELPNLPPKGDIVDWCAAGGTAQQLGVLTAAAPDYAGAGDTEPMPLARDLPPAEPFPLEAMGDLAKAAQAICDLVQSPIEMCASAVLAAVSFAASAHVNVLLPTGEIKPASSWFWCIAESGERKTSTDDRAFAAFKRREAQLRMQHEAELEGFGVIHTLWSAQAKAVEKEFKNPGVAGSEAHKIALEQLGLEPEKPLEPLLLSSEFTFEGLVRCLHLGQPIYGVCGSEGGQFFGGHGMAEDARTRTITGLSAAWDGEPIKRVRAAETVILPGRRIGMHLMVQPRIAMTALSDGTLQEQGFMSRVLVCTPKGLTGTRFYRQPPPSAALDLQEYENRILAILDTPYPLADKNQKGEKKRNELAPRLVTFSESARELFWKFHDNIEEAQNPGGAYEAISSLANKLKEHAARLAVALAYYQRPDVTELTENDFRRGISLVSYYAREATRISASTSYSSPEQAEKHTQAQALNAWLLSGASDKDTITVREIYTFGPRKIRNKETALAAAKILADHHWLERLITGRRGSHAWKIKKISQT